MTTSDPVQMANSEWNGVEWNNNPSMARAEDPLDAIDALDDAIEEVGQSLPSVMEDKGLESPVKPNHTSHDQTLNANGRANGQSANQGSPGKVNMSPQSRSTLHQASPGKAFNDRQKENNTPIKAGSHSTGRPLAGTPPRASFSSTGSPSVSGQVGSRKSSHSSTPPTKTPSGRISQGSRRSESPAKLSVQKPGFVPLKSIKDPTRPTFELPGEAISRRKREKQEEKRRQEEEEQKKKREFKARGVGYARNSEVRETATSRARANRSSLVLEPRTETPTKRESGTPTPGRVSSTRNVSNDSGVQSPSMPRTQSVRTNATNRLSMASPDPRTRKPDTTTSGTPAVKQDPIAKGKSWTQEKRQREQDRQDKEEAARRARAEAAERSRQAGRAWAEKQRLKNQAAKPSDSK